MRNTLWIAASTSLLLLAGCGEDDKPETDTSSDTTADTSPDATGDTTGDTSDTTGTEVECGAELVANTMFRVDHVTLTAPAGIGTILETLMNTDFEAQKLHIMVDIGVDSTTWPDDFQLTGNAGKIVSGTADDPAGIVYGWFDGLDIEYKPATIDEDGVFINNENLSLTFPALAPGIPEPILIPVDELGLQGGLAAADDCTWSFQGRLQGAILLEKIEGLNVALAAGTEPRPLKDILQVEAMDYPVDAAVKTGWTLDGLIDGRQVAFEGR